MLVDAYYTENKKRKSIHIAVLLILLYQSDSKCFKHWLKQLQSIQYRRRFGIFENKIEMEAERAGVVQTSERGKQAEREGEKERQNGRSRNDGQVKMTCLQRTIMWIVVEIKRSSFSPIHPDCALLFKHTVKWRMQNINEQSSNSNNHIDATAITQPPSLPTKTTRPTTTRQKGAKETCGRERDGNEESESKQRGNKLIQYRTAESNKHNNKIHTKLLQNAILQLVKV